MRYGIREICDVVLRAKSAMKLGNKIYYKDEPVIRFDSLKTSSLEQAATTVYATGGRGNARLVAWEGEKNVTFTMEDALLTPESFSVLTGARLSEDSSGDLNSATGGSIAENENWYSTVLEGSKAAKIDPSFDITGFSFLTDGEEVANSVIWKLPQIDKTFLHQMGEGEIRGSAEVTIYNKRTNKYIKDYPGVDELPLFQYAIATRVKVEEGGFTYFAISDNNTITCLEDEGNTDYYLFVVTKTDLPSELDVDWSRTEDWMLRLDLYDKNAGAATDSSKIYAEQINEDGFTSRLVADSIPASFNQLDYDPETGAGTLYLEINVDTGRLPSSYLIPNSLYPNNEDQEATKNLAEYLHTQGSNIQDPRVVSLTHNNIDIKNNYNPVEMQQQDYQFNMIFSMDFTGANLSSEAIEELKTYNNDWNIKANVGTINRMYYPQAIIDAQAQAPYIHDFDFIEVPAGIQTLESVGLYIDDKLADVNWSQPVYISLVDNNGEIISEPYPLTDTSVVLASWDFRQAHRYKVDYYRNVPKVKRLEIEPDKFGTNFYLEASTLFRDNRGVDHPAEFVVPNCKIQSNFTMTMASSGDPSTFTFTMDAFPGYVRFKPDKKVLAAVQLLDDGASKSDLVRTQTNHAAAHESLITW